MHLDRNIRNEKRHLIGQFNQNDESCENDLRRLIEQAFASLKSIFNAKQICIVHFVRIDLKIYIVHRDDLVKIQMW